MPDLEIRSETGNKPEMDFELKIFPLGDLIGHEMIIDVALEDFKTKVVEMGYLMRPILVDKTSKLILDGHHRSQGLKDLNYIDAPVIMIDYLDDTLINLDTWYPLINVVTDDVIELLREKGFEIKNNKFNNEESLDKLRNREFAALIGDIETNYIVKGEREDVFKIVRDEWLDQIKYYDNQLICLENANNKTTAIISWSYKKREVLDFVKSNGVFLPKTTRHTLNYRYDDCDYPLSKLTKIE